MTTDTIEHTAAAVDEALADDGLPTGSTIWATLANAVMAAYDAYNNGENNQPTLPGYNNFTSIYAFEADPNVNPFTMTGADAAERARAASAASASDSTPSPGYQLFGFSAVADDLSHNIVSLRGTVTAEEAGYDLTGWGDNTDCMLPSSSPTTNYGSVKKDLYNFYVATDLDVVTSLAASFNAAVQNLAAVNPGAPWFIAAHSLGGALATLAALDAFVSSSYGVNAPPPWLATFGSLHIGEQTFADNFNSQLLCLRFANLSDFVPSFVALEPGPPTSYVHVGIECTFVWEKWDDWANHSMQYTYLPAVQDYFSVIKFGPRQYPQ